MPTDFLAADAGFPDLGQMKSQEEKLGAIMGYLRLLLEQLRYTLDNLGCENFNERELSLLGEVITQPLELRLKTVLGEMADLSVEAGGILTRVENLQGQSTQLEQTAQALKTRVQGLDGRFSQVEQTVGGLEIKSENGTSVINGSHIKSGTIEGSTLVCSLQGEDSVSQGRICLVHEGVPVGEINLSTDGTGEAEESRYRMFVSAAGDFVLKLQSQGDTSYTTVSGNMFLRAGAGKITLSAPQGTYIKTSTGASYGFRPDGIYFGERKLISTEGVAL